MSVWLRWKGDEMNDYITAIFGGSNRTRTKPLHKYDENVVLKFSGIPLPPAYEVHFSNYDRAGVSITMIGSENGVSIPNDLLTTGYTIYAWIYLHATQGNGMTVYTVEIPVIDRPQPEEYEPSGQSPWEQVVAILTDAVETAEENMTLSKSWAVGDTGVRPGENSDNAKYYARMAQQGAAEKGFVSFAIVAPGYLTMYITDNLTDAINFVIDTNGELEVQIL